MTRFLEGLFRGRTPPPSGRPTRSPRLALEALDDRLVPSSPTAALPAGFRPPAYAAASPDVAVANPGGPVVAPPRDLAAAPQRGPTEVTVGRTAGAATIQTAVDLVADGGTVRLEGKTYTENVRIAGKTVHISGVAGQSRVRAADPTQAVIRYDQACGVLSRVELTGGVAGVSGFRPGTDAVMLVGVAIADTGTGVSGQFRSLWADGVTIRDCSGWGANVRTLSKACFSETDVYSCAGGGVRVEAVAGGTGGAWFGHCDVSFNGDTGIWVRGGQASTLIENSYVRYNARFGVYLDGVGDGSVVRGTQLTRTAETPDGMNGGGLIVVDSRVTVDDVRFDRNEGFGLFAVAHDGGCVVRVTTVEMTAHPMYFASAGCAVINPVRGEDELYCYDEAGRRVTRFLFVDDLSICI